jgi:hypothetical protein
MIDINQFTEPVKHLEYQGNFYKFSKCSHLFVDEPNKDTQLVDAALIYNATGDYLTVASSELNPIPLTPEILEKCGFKKYVSPGGNTTTYSLGENWLFDASRDKLILMFPNSFKNVPKYLHQLQNLYFVLEGEELTVNL